MRSINIPPPNVKTGKNNVRNLLALGLTGMVLLATIIVAVWALFISEPADISFIGQSLLPLWGTWVGTVIAFYFGRENFEAATKSYSDVITRLTPEERIATIPVKEIMIPVADIKYMEYDDTTVKKPLLDMLNEPIFKEYQRIAFLTREKTLKFIIHKSTIALFITEKMQQTEPNGRSVKLEDITLKDMIEYNNQTSKIPDMLKRGYTFLSEKATLLEAKCAMESIPECQDVFITTNGRASEPVMGLITNNTIMEQTRV
jgi:hypothetical protein